MSDARTWSVRAMLMLGDRPTTVRYPAEPPGTVLRC